ncbi:hypothetical protein T484DRAFT_1862220 [Baffinella frigidus]|nr:hypothetical protein T484DRAFT_1862220 [Cryptophyta sp. CCMP2293]
MITVNAWKEVTEEEKRLYAIFLRFCQGEQFGDALPSPIPSLTASAAQLKESAAQPKDSRAEPPPLVYFLTTSQRPSCVFAPEDFPGSFQAPPTLPPPT